MFTFSSQKAAFWHLWLLQGLSNYLSVLHVLHSSEPTTQGKIFLTWSSLAESVDWDQQKALNLKSGKKKGRFLTEKGNFISALQSTSESTVIAVWLLSYARNIVSIFSGFFPPLLVVLNLFLRLAAVDLSSCSLQWVKTATSKYI